MKYSFETALVFLKQGKKIRRAAWDEDHGTLVLTGSYIYCAVRGAFPHLYKFFSDDILAEDWEVLE